MLVLIVEPDEDRRDLVVSYLVAQNFLLETARTPEQAIAKALLIPPDVVLLDLDQPGSQAVETFRRLKSSLHTSGIPVIGVSSPSRRASRARWLAAGCAILDQPFSSEALVTAVRGAQRRTQRVPRAGGRRLRFPRPPVRRF